MAQSNSGTTLVETLPPELLSRIFLLLKQEEERERFDDFNSRHLSGTVADVFTQECRYFGEVARGCALLWTTVSIDERTPLDRVQTYCARSGSALMSLRISFRENWGVRLQRAEHIFQLLGVLQHHRCRWKLLSLELGREMTDNRSIVAFLCTSPAPNLESLTLSIAEVNAIDASVASSSPVIPTIFTEGTDKLSTLRFRGLAVHIFRPPLQKLSTLHLDGVLAVPISYRILLAMLAAPWNLTHLSMYGHAVYDWPEEVYDPLSIISLPHLHHLRIHTFDGKAFQGILLNLYAPLLHSLTLKGIVENDLTGVDTRRNSLVFFPQVQELVFLDIDLSQVGLAAVFRMFPSIETFRVLDTNFGFSIRSLSTVLGSESLLGGVSGMTGIPWPRLRTLHIALGHWEDANLLLILLQKRREIERPLSQVEITEQEFGDFAVEDWMVEVTGEETMDAAVTMTDRGDIGWPSDMRQGLVDPDDDLFG